MIIKLIRRFITACDGMAAAEFALAAPMMFALFLGGSEVSRLLIVNVKAEKAAATVSDVIAQSQTLTLADVNSIMAAAAQVMEPFSFGADGVVIVSSVYKNGTAAPTVRWQVTGGGTLSHTSQIGTLNATATLPTGFTMNDKDNIIIAEVYYNFTPMFNTGVTPASTIYKTSYFKPRLGVLTTPPT